MPLPDSRDPIRRYAYLLPCACLIVAIAIAVSSYRYYQDQKARIKNGARERLATIAQLKVQQVVEWRRERIADGKTVAAAENMPSVRDVLRGRAAPAERDRVLHWMRTLRDATGYANVILVDKAGKSRLSVGGLSSAEGHYRALAENVLSSGEVSLSDIHYDAGLKGPHLGLAIPLRIGWDVPPEGVLLLGIDPNAFLYPLLRSWPTPSQTGETLLARREGDSVVYLNELRHRKGAALTLRLPLRNERLPASRAALGYQGLTDGVDYRGMEVVAAVCKVPDSPWLLVAKEDAEEIYEPVREQAFWLALIACSLALSIGVGAALLWRDVRVSFRREREEAQARWQALLAHFDYLTRFANDIILLTDDRGAIVEANDRALTAYRYTRHELIGKSLKELRDPVTVADYEKQWASLGEEGGLMFETVHRRKDGTSFPVEVSARRILVGTNAFTQSIIRDVSERHQAEHERAKLQDQLLQAQKMESVGRLAGGVAHDFNNLLTVINGYSSFALDELNPNHPLHSPLVEIGKAGERAAALTQQLLAFSRKQVFDPKVLDLNEVVADVTKMLRRLVGEDIEVATHLSASEVRVRADQGQLQQVLMNLATNARDAMRGGGRLVIETERVEINDGYTAGHADAAPGNYVLLAVSDTGVGMEKAVRERAFEPFFTTKPEGEGTGLGLSTVYGIVRQSGGWIWLYSEPGRGTTFKIYLPSVDEPATTERPDAVSGDLNGTETVLIVEDQAEVRQLAAEVLSRHGYKVIEAAGGSEALSLCNSFQGSIDLMLTDVVMPGMTGRELAARLNALSPNTKVLYTSGYTSNVIAHEGVLDPGVAYLPKPFSPFALVRKVSEMLHHCRE